MKRQFISIAPLVRWLSVRFAPEVVLLVVGLVIVYPLWVTLRPPIQDLPQHVAAVRVLASFSDSSFRFQEYFELTLAKTQYLTVYLLAIPFAKLFGPTVATKLVLSAALLATPIALVRLTRALGFEPWLACLSLPFVFNVHVAYGFLNFVAAIPLMFLGLALGVEQRQKPTWQGQAWLSFTLLVCFLTHVVPFGLLAIACALLARPNKPAVLRQALVILPSGVATASWLLASPAGKVVSSLGRTVSETPLSVSHLPFGMAIRMIPDWVIHITTTEGENMRLIAWFMAALVLLVLAVALRNRYELPPNIEGSEGSLVAGRLVVLALVPLSMAGYFMLPNGYGFIWPICQRFPVLAILLGSLVLGCAPRWAIRLAAVVSIALGVQAAREQSHLFRDSAAVGYRGFDEVIERIPRGSRVATLVFDRQLDGLQLSPLMHAAGWVQAERGGMVMFTFAEFPSSPFTYRPDRRPPAVAPRWEWGPDRVVPDRDLGWYDYCLVHGWSGSLEHSRRFNEVLRRGRWSLWRQNGHTDPSLPAR